MKRMYKAYIASLDNKVSKVSKVTRPGGEDADTLAKRVDCGSDEELGDGWEDGDDHQGQEEVLALVESSQHRGCSFDLMFIGIERESKKMLKYQDHAD